MQKTLLAILIGFLLQFAITPAMPAAVIDPELQDVLNAAGPNEEVSVIATLADRVDLGRFKDGNRKIRRARITRALKNKATLSQGPLKAFLQGKGARRIVRLWLLNGMAVTAKANVIQALANRPGVERVRLDGTLEAPWTAAAPSATPEWNIAAIRAPELWDLGYTGAGIVVAGMDTGVDAAHPDLAPRWRGGYNSWFDPHGEHATPVDTNGHGTQTMSIMVGGAAGGSAIGVAPDARWIAVKMYNDAGWTSYSDIHLGFQWLVDPDDNPDTDDAPDVVNNSWGFSTPVTQCFTEFQPDIQALKAAGIAVVFSGGNQGDGPDTSESPANYPESFAVGAVDQSLSIASFSSRGTGACDTGIYPEVVAPGVGVRTADRTFGGSFSNNYTNSTGTSFAAPHVAGAMALLLSALPNTTVAELESAVEESALDLGAVGPDNEYGAGLLDVVETYYWIAGLAGNPQNGELQFVPPPTVRPKTAAASW
jgi:serine protease AprX